MRSLKGQLSRSISRIAETDFAMDVGKESKVK
jgi:hypothetical protein